MSPVEPVQLLNFIMKNWLNDRSLEIGCGCGDLVHLLPITDAVEPSTYRIIEARAKMSRAHIKQGFIESLPYPNKQFTTVLCIDTLHLVRSDMEGLTEVNRVLKTNGHFIFDLWEGDMDLVVGRMLEVNNYCRFVSQFGFQLVEKSKFDFYSNYWQKNVSRWGLCFKKVKDFEFSSLVTKSDLRDKK